MFFERTGPSSSSSLPTCSNKGAAPAGDSPQRRRRLMMLGLAVAVATPATALRLGQEALAGAPEQGPTAGNGTDLRADFAPDNRAASLRADFGGAPTAAPVPTIATVLQAAATTDAQLLKQGQDAYNAGDYETAQTALQQVNASQLSDRDRRTLSDTLNRAASAATERRAARAQFELGETALREGRTAEAVTHYQAAIGNRFADDGIRAKSREQIELARRTAPAPVAAAPTADAAAQTSPTPAVVVAPSDGGSDTANTGTVTDTATTVVDPAAAAASGMSPRQHYDTAVRQYKAGDWASARANFVAARDGGYRKRAFQDSPERFLARMDKKEQADAARNEARLAADARRADQERQDAQAAADRAAAEQAQAQTAATAAPVVAAAPAVGNGAIAQATAPAATEVAPTTVVTPAEVTPAPVTPVEVTPAAPAAPSAQSLVDEANQAVGRGDFNQASTLFDRAVALDPQNADAIEGRRRMGELTGQTPQAGGLLARERAAIEARRAAIQYNFDDALGDANEAIRTNNFEVARTSLERARLARNTDTTIFGREELANFDSRIGNTQAALTSSRDAFAQRQIQTGITETTRQQEERLAQIAAENERTVRGLITQTQTAIKEGRYKDAENTIEQILVLDRRNDYAIGVRPFVRDQANFAEQRGYRERFDQEMTKTLNKAEEGKIPYDEIIRYPDNWPDLSAQRDRTVNAERGIEQEDAAVQAQLDRRLPELRFDAVGFTDVIDFLRDVSDANIFVNWRALEAAGIDRSAPVTARLRDVPFRKALNIILQDVGGGTVKLAYTIDEGVITISTGDELATNTTTQTYDIRDLIINVPDFANAPTFSLESSSSGGGGEGGGGGGGGLFGDGGGETDEEEEGPTRAELVEQITTLIQANVDSASWQLNGGTVGTLSELNGTLIVTQTPENQDRVSALLEKLREQRAIQVTVETRFLTVQRNFLEDIGVDFDFSFNTQGAVSERLTSVNIGNGTADFTAAPQTGVPGTIGSTANGLSATDINGAPISFTFLDDFQVNFLIRATQAAQTSTNLTAPRITLFNGQRAYVIVATERAYVSDLTPTVGQNSVAFDPEIDVIQSGVKLDVQATVSSDRKYVTLTLRPELSTLINLFQFSFATASSQPATGGVGTDGGVVVGGASAGTGIVQQPEIQTTQVQTTVSVPDGGTLLLGGQTLAGEIEREAGVPVLSKIPFLKRLFTNRSMAKDEQVLLILVKPTIIIQREVEERQFPLLSTRIAGE